MKRFFTSPKLQFPAGSMAVRLVLISLFSLILSGQAFAAGAVKNGGHKIQVNDPALARALTARGETMIADYGSYQLFAVSQLDVELATNAFVELRDDYHLINLNAAALDTRLPEVKALTQPIGDFAGKRLHLIHFAGPVQPGWHADLLAAGVQIVDYIPENAYLVYGDAAAIAQVQALAANAPHIQWEGAYLDDYKIDPKARATDAAGNPREIGTDEFMVQLMADATANTNTLLVLDQLKLAPIIRQYSILHYVNVQLRLSPADIALVATQPDVISIQPYFKRQKFDERQDQIVAGNLTGNVPTGPGYLSWLASKGFTQAQFTNSGFAVDVSDSGIDDGTTTPHHFGLFVSGQLSNASRVLYNRLEGTPNSGSTLMGCDGHGTLNTHIIAGYVNSKATGLQDSAGFHYGLGVCPFVNVGSSVIFDPDNFTSPNYSTLQNAAYSSGARISNNSWGANTAGAYDTDSQSYDVLVRDAQSGVAGNQEMVIVFAAGNAGSATKTVGAPGTAKNVITVGAADGVQAFGGIDGSGIGDNEASSANEMASFSSRGPCSDGRHKPEITAPGTHISGGIIQSNMPGPSGTADPCFTGTGISGGVGSPFFPPGQQFYGASDGTSHSTPCVSGGCALLRQYFINNFTNPPSPAMTKAFLMNSARYMTGATANDTLWSDAQGMGEMNLGMAFDGVARILRDEVPADLFTASGQTRSFSGIISDTNSPFRVSISWTDAPGSTTGNAYKNNLDLTVNVNGNLYKGNVFNGAFSTNGGTADLRNNSECVFLPAGISGSFIVTVTGTSINSIGVPNAGNVNEQDFALVIYNGVTAALPVLQGTSAMLMAEGCLPTNGVVDPNETVTMNFSLQNVSTVSTTNLVATLLTTTGVTPLSGPQTFGVVAAGGSGAQPFTFTAAGTCGGNITATLQLQDGAVNLGNVSFTIPTGTFVSTNILSQNFDSVTAPALPAGWTTTASGQQSPWTTSTTATDTAPNAAFAAGPNNVGVAELLSPTIPIVSSSAQLSFRNNYNMQQTSSTVGNDGGVLEIAIGTGAFTDIISAGGSFVTGGYNRTIATTRSSPIAGRSAWSGNSGGFITTTINLPASTAGHNIQLKWRCATDSGVASTGWYIDTITVHDAYFVCCSPNADIAISQSVTPGPELVGQNMTYTLVVTNPGPVSVPDLMVTNVLPANAAFASASSGSVLISNKVFYTVNSLPVGAATNLTLTVTPTAIGPLTNTASAGSSTILDLNPANNISVLVVTAVAPPAIFNSPTNESVVAGSSPTLVSSVGGTSPFGFQWLFNGTNISGATDSTLSLPNIPAADAGTYSIIVTNLYGGTTGVIATLTVLIPPTITNSPQSQMVVVGANVNFSTGASGDVPLGYQWLFNGANIAGATTTTLSLLNVQANQSGGYSVLVTNDGGAVTSAVAMLTVVVPPVITNQPAAQTVAVGTNATFFAGVSGTAPFGFQWFFNGTNISGATTNPFTLSNLQTNQTGSYSVIVTNLAGTNISLGAQLTVLIPPSITNQPTSVKVNIGTNVSFQVGTVGSAPLAFQWLFNGTNIAGATTNSLTLTNVQSLQAGAYTVLVTNLVGQATSTPAQLTVLVTPIVTSIGVNGTDVAISFASLTGCNYTLQYKNTLLDANWTSIAPTTPGNGGVLTLHDTYDGTQPTRFYRVNVN